LNYSVRFSPGLHIAPNPDSVLPSDIHNGLLTSKPQTVHRGLNKLEEAKQRMAQALERESDVEIDKGIECGRCGKPVHRGRGFSFKVVPGASMQAADSEAGQITKCLFCAVRHSTMLKRSLTVAVVVGSLLTILNQGDLLFAGHWKGAMYWKIPLTYCVPFCVATYGALSNSRR